MIAELVAAAALMSSPQCNDLDGDAELACVMQLVTAPDDGVPIRPGVPCVDQPTADSETRCLLAEHPPPADPNDGAAWCGWQRALFTQAGVQFTCTWNGKDY